MQNRRDCRLSNRTDRGTLHLHATKEADTRFPFKAGE